MRWCLPACAALALVSLRCGAGSLERKRVLTIDAVAGSGFSEDPSHLHSNKDCGPNVVAATEAFADAHKMIVLAKEVSADRALVHFRTPDDERRYLEVLYRHEPKKYAAHLSFDLLLPSGAGLDPSGAMLPDDVESFRKSLGDAVNCE
jgi:hypothetical protein